MSWDTVVNAAELAWKVIEDNAASAEIDSKTASAVPQVEDWQALSDTQGPNIIRIPYKNRFMWPLDDYLHVDIQIALKWRYGGRYKGGGAFIPSVWIEVPELFVGFPWSANINVYFRNPANVGSATAPLAAIDASVRGTVSSGAERHGVEWGYTLYGNGAATQTS